ncbi:hypothetical protein PR048_003364 [Dryococelus australis]|uniref:Uncharacterized protein n=1 Tax=Dryococelus australis TaxID=614101 RepID=A0ABQ9IMW3_9NEOP|nr:hypothetical protein PR048_003364 [Dryococelus australis]
MIYFSSAETSGNAIASKWCSSLQFYKRSLWTFNLTVYAINDTKKAPCCYVWDDSIAGRGVKEISSCIYHHISSSLHDCCLKKKNTYSDSYYGKNLNIYFPLMILNTLANPKLSGKNMAIANIHMYADTIYAAIGKIKNNTTAKIELPRGWANIIRLVQRKPAVEVTELQHQFLHIRKLLTEMFVHRKLNSTSELIQ